MFNIEAVRFHLHCDGLIFCDIVIIGLRGAIPGSARRRCYANSIKLIWDGEVQIELAADV